MNISDKEKSKVDFITQRCPKMIQRDKVPNFLRIKTKQIQKISQYSENILEIVICQYLTKDKH